MITMGSRIVLGAKSLIDHIQGSTKGWALGCLNSHPAARGSQEARITQPKAHLLVEIFVGPSSVFFRDCKTYEVMNERRDLSTPLQLLTLTLTLALTDSSVQIQLNHCNADIWRS